MNFLNFGMRMELVLSTEYNKVKNLNWPKKQQFLLKI